jgi:hypothetical protein
MQGMQLGMMWPCSEALAAGGRRAGDLHPVAALTGGATHSGQGSGAKTNTFDREWPDAT